MQENPLPEDVAHSIPSHIQTDDFIPSVLEASSKAITDDHLNPDEVEIVTHAVHQPAIVTVSANSAHPDSGPEPDATANGNLSFPDVDDNASSYGALDTSDIRRLSFISFADVVQAEHLEASGTRDPLLHLSMSPTTTNRSPSPPVRSPASAASSHFGVPSPPTSGAPSVKGVEVGSGGKTQQQKVLTGSPPLHAAGSGAQSPSLVGGDLVVETMRQALRKTNSGDLSGYGHGLPLSALSLDDGNPDHPPFKP